MRKGFEGLFGLGRGRDGPKQFLDKFEGILQTDAYAAYEQVGGPKLVHACCWSHARRAFFEAAQLNPQDAVAVAIVARMDQLFAIDAQARREGLDPAARHTLRQQQAPPLLEESSPGSRRRARPPCRPVRWPRLAAHAHAVAKTYLLPTVSRAGVEQQPGGKLDASDSDRTKELDPHRQRPGRSQGRGHSFCSGKLPPDEVIYTRLPGNYPSRPRRGFDPARRRTDALRLGCPTPINPSRQPCTSSDSYKEQMGHSSIQVTVDVYGHLIPGANIEWIDRLDRAAETSNTDTGEKGETVARNG